jgi:hypothetical protein
MTNEAKRQVRAIRRRHGRNGAEQWAAQRGLNLTWSGNDVAVRSIG